MHEVAVSYVRAEAMLWFTRLVSCEERGYIRPLSVDNIVFHIEISFDNILPWISRKNQYYLHKKRDIIFIQAKYLTKKEK